MIGPHLPVATWSIELNTECPGCVEYVDLLDLPDFWDGRSMEIGEHGTERTRQFEAMCPECRHEWTVEVVY